MGCGVGPWGGDEGVGVTYIDAQDVEDGDACPRQGKIIERSGKA